MPSKAKGDVAKGCIYKFTPYLFCKNFKKYCCIFLECARCCNARDESHQGEIDVVVEWLAFHPFQFLPAIINHTLIICFCYFQLPNKNNVWV